jgi:hypothetical protein
MENPYAQLYSYMHKIDDEYNQCIIKMYCIRPGGGTAIVKIKEFKPYFGKRIIKTDNDNQKIIRKNQKFINSID